MDGSRDGVWDGCCVRRERCSTLSRAQSHAETMPSCDETAAGATWWPVGAAWPSRRPSEGGIDEFSRKNVTNYEILPDPRLHQLGGQHKASWASHGHGSTVQPCRVLSQRRGSGCVARRKLARLSTMQTIATTRRTCAMKSGREPCIFFRFAATRDAVIVNVRRVIGRFKLCCHLREDQ